MSDDPLPYFPVVKFLTVNFDILPHPHTLFFPCEIFNWTLLDSLYLHWILQEIDPAVMDVDEIDNDELGDQEREWITIGCEGCIVVMLWWSSDFDQVVMVRCRCG